MSTTTDTQPSNSMAHLETQQALMRLINGYQVSQLIHVAAKLGIADLLADGPKSAAEVAERTGAHAPSLYRALRALASFGIFAEEEDRRFRLTPLAELLRSDVPGSARGWAVFIGEAEPWRAWEELLYSVTTGETAFRHVHGMSSWEYRERDPQAGAIFNDAMVSLSSMRNQAVMAAYGFSGIGTLVDVGGGHGAFIAAILRAYPDMHGVLFDLPHVVAGAQPVLEAAGVTDRCRVVGGDAFEGVPRGGDAYCLSKIIHGWGDDRAIVILSACRRAMTEHGKLLLVEWVIPPANRPHRGKLSDINMLVMEEGGRERTEEEFRALLNAAGFRLTRIVTAADENSVIEAIPS